MRDLSLEDFGEPGLLFLPDGRVLPKPRPTVKPHVLAAEDLQ
jgi:hypothetical protein